MAHSHFDFVCTLARWLLDIGKNFQFCTTTTAKKNNNGDPTQKQSLSSRTINFYKRNDASHAAELSQIAATEMNDVNCISIY